MSGRLNDPKGSIKIFRLADGAVVFMNKTPEPIQVCIASDKGEGEVLETLQIGIGCSVKYPKESCVLSYSVIPYVDG